MTETAGATCECKVGRGAREFGVESLDAALQRRREEGESLRGLARYVNVRLLEGRLAAADVTVAGDAESVYEVLEGEDVAPERRADVADRLSYAGVDLASLRAAFVSHQTVKTHLNDCLGVATDREGVTTVEEARELIDWARDKEERTIERTLAQLADADTLGVADPAVTVSVTVRCGDCGDSFRVADLLGGRDCGCTAD